MEDNRVKDTALAVAPLLGEGWALDETARNNEFFTHIRKGEACLSFGGGSYYREPTKLYISGEFPRHRDGSEIYRAARPYGHTGPWHRISVNMTRPVKQIAGEITRRLLPEYLLLLALCLHDREEEAKRVDTRNARVRDFCAALGVEPKFGEKDGDSPRVSFGKIEQTKAYGDIEFHYDGDIVIRLRIKDLALAKSLARLLAPHVLVSLSKHRLVIYSLRDLKAHCMCGGWELATPALDDETEGMIRRRALSEWILHFDSLDECEQQERDPSQIIPPDTLDAVKALWDALSNILEDADIATHITPEERRNGLKAIEQAQAAFPEEA